ncbi:MAG: flavin reductase family protein [Acidimicrobiia bacterium]|nr:flavin reductase family protein [Acidimicrobiia bacterium]
MTDIPSAPEIDPGDFRHVLGHFPTGVTVVTTDGEPGAGRPAGVTIGSFTSISLDPPLVGFYIGSGAGTRDAVEAAGHFCVNILADDQQDLSNRMASKADDKFEGIGYELSETGSPILPDVLGIIDCRIHEVIEAGDHDLIIGRVLNLSVRREARPLLFFKGQYGSFSG